MHTYTQSAFRGHIYHDPARVFLYGDQLSLVVTHQHQPDVTTLIVITNFLQLLILILFHDRLSETIQHT